MRLQTLLWLLLLTTPVGLVFAQGNDAVTTTGERTLAPGLTAVPLPVSLAQHVLQPRESLRVVCWTEAEVLVNAVLPVGTDGMVLPPGLAPLRAAGVKLGDLQAQLAESYGATYPGATLLVTYEGPGAAALSPTPPATAPGVDILQTPLVPGTMLALRGWTGDLVHLDILATVAPDATLSLPPLGRLNVRNETLLTLRNLLQARYRGFYPGCSFSLLLKGKSAPGTEGPTAPLPETPIWQKFPPAVTASEILEGLPRFGSAVFRAGTQDPAVISAGMPAGNLPVPADYLLGPGDKLAVRCWTGAVEHYSLEGMLTAEGRLYVPKLGEMAAAGQTLAQLTDQLSQRSRKLFRDCQTTVVLSQIRTVDVYVTGDVTTPGKYSLPGTATVFTALYAAGGPAKAGSLRAIRLMRKGAAPRHLDLYPYLLTGDRQGDEALASGDTLFVGQVGPTLGVSGLVRRPGLYEMAQELTCAEALNLAGGLEPRGYGRNVELWRVDQNTAWNVINLDLSLPANNPQGPACKLQSGDLLLVRPILEKPANTVEIVGAVRRPGTYEVGPGGLDVKSLLAKAQGVDETAYVQMAAIWRLTPTNDYRHLRLNLLRALQGEKPDNMPLQPGDRLYVYSRYDVLQAQEVTIQGAVANPGVFPWAEQMRLTDLLLQARGLLDGAYTLRADLRRLNASFQREIVPVNLSDVLAGKEAADIALQPGDQLTVYTQKEVAVPAEVVLAGFVQRPGTYERTAGMKASDLIVLGGGLLPGAGAEVEYVKGRTAGTAVATRLKLNQAEIGKLALDPDPVLHDDDSVNVLGVGGFQTRAQLVRVQGMISKPGSYALMEAPEQPDTVYKLITRAGGLLPGANPRGIILYRPKDSLLDPNQADEIAHVLQGFNRERANTQATLGPEQKAAAVSGNLNAQLATVMSGQEGSTLVIPPRPLNAADWGTAIPIEGEKLMASKGQEADMPLALGDVLVVPTTPTTAAIIGAVVRPGAVKYMGPKSPLEYVAAVGGASQDAVLARLVVIRANGAVTPYAKDLTVFPGDVIVVPSDYLVRHVSATSKSERFLRALVSVATAFLIF